MSRNRESISTWEILNSNFVIWALSSILLSGAGLVYNEHKDNLRIESERSNAIRKIDTEISSRLIHLNDLLSLEYESLDREGLRKVGLVLDEPLKSGYPINIFPEFSSMNFRVLLWDLSQAVPDEQKAEIDQAYSCLSQLISNMKLQDKMKEMLKEENLEKMSSSDREMYMTGTNVLGGVVLKQQFNEFLLSVNLKRWGNPITYISQNKIVSWKSALNEISAKKLGEANKAYKPCT